VLSRSDNFRGPKNVNILINEFDIIYRLAKSGSLQEESDGSSIDL
jgi:hypothetical protein